MDSFKLLATGEKWNSRDEKLVVKASTAEQAITKARILKGEDFYRRLYWIAAITEEGLWEITDLCSYGMLREKMRRDYGLRDANRRARA